MPCKSCGSVGSERDVIRTAWLHGGKTHRAALYRVWCNMRSRCNRETDPSYKWYGAKGVKICNEWNTFKMFRIWALANGYAAGLSIDRIDSDGDYTPENCRWITMLENQPDLKLSADQVYAIRESRKTVRELCEEFDCHNSHIIRIRKRQSRLDVPERDPDRQSDDE